MFAPLTGVCGGSGRAGSGLPRHAAKTFADMDLSPHDLEELVKRGCNPLIAPDLLLP